LLKCKAVSAAYGVMKVLHHVSLEITEKELVALIGANSAGKTTLLKIISGLLRPVDGEVIFKGSNLVVLLPHTIVHRGIILIPEGRWVFPEMTVHENLMMGGYNSRAKPNREANLARVFELFPNLQGKRNQMAGSLSGGEQQMLAVGRALMAEPLLLMLDEPSLGLAPLVVDHIFEVLLKLNRQGMTILLVEQNVQLSLEVAQRCYVLEHGRMILQGSSKELQENEAVKRAYLGI
jgi:branched-chain amino acid transport system ATP-binding protein